VVVRKPPQRKHLRLVTTRRTPQPPRPATPPVIARATSLGRIGYCEAKFYRRGPRRSAAIWVVLHATHGAEGRSKAEDGAHEHATLSDDAKKRSTHVFVDTDSIVQCVPWESEAYHCGSHGNRYGEGVELCGSADQTREQWLDALSLPMLELAALLVRWRCEQLRIPMQFRSATQLRVLMPGITTHAEITKAFPKETTHPDPGTWFPINDFIDAVRR
jgi:N-acetylmuramoyl-L-alanine amidase